MTAASSIPRGFLAIAVAAALGVLVVAPAASVAAQPLTVTKSNVLRGAKPIPDASIAKKKRKGRATTRSTAISFGSGSSTAATGSCTGKSHLTGGGFAVSPPFSGSSGLPSIATQSQPVGKKDWIAGSYAFAAPATSGTLTSFARCESNSLGRTIELTIGGAVPPGTTTTALLDCPARTHVLGGGFLGTPPAGQVLASLRTFILASRRTNVSQWAVTAYTASGSPVAAQFAAYAICERDGKGRNVTEASTLAAIGSDTRTSGDATCPGKRHVVSGGFEVTDADANTTPAPFFDESHPLGEKGWHIGLWESIGINMPAGSQIQTFAYCKKIPKAKDN